MNKPTTIKVNPIKRAIDQDYQLWKVVDKKLAHKMIKKIQDDKSIPQTLKKQALKKQILKLYYGYQHSKSKEGITMMRDISKFATGKNIKDLQNDM